MAKKIDLSRFKAILFVHGEKIALGVCAAIALTFGTMGMFKAMSVSRADNSQKSWEQELRDTSNRILSEISAAEPKELPDATKKLLEEDYYVWGELKRDWKPGPYVPISDSGNNSKRVNPVPLSIRTGPKDIQMDYIRALALTHDADLRTQVWRGLGGVGDPNNVAQPMPKVGGGGTGVPVSLPEPLRVGVPVRMVRVTAAFPLKQQVEEFRKALRYPTQKELFDRPEDLPRFVGINVVRYQLNEKGEPIGKEVELIKVTQRSKPLDDLLRVAIIDRVQPEVMKRYLYNGLVSPLPTLANARYPNINLDGFELEYPQVAEEVIDPNKGVQPVVQPPIQLPGGKRPGEIKMPGQPPVVGQPQPGFDRKIVEIKRSVLKDADPNLERRLFGGPGTEFNNRNIVPDYNVSHALGLFPPPNLDPKGAVNPVPGGRQADDGLYFSAWQVEPPMVGAGGFPVQPPRGQPQPGGGQDQQFPNWGRDALVSFIDPDVVPGATYSYKIQVRISNPNYKHPRMEELAFAALSNVPELVIGNTHPKWEYTPTITIPHEYSLYAADQQLIDEWSGKQAKKGAAPVDAKQRDMTSFQIHLWAKKERDFVNQQDHEIGDTVIAERIMVRRGEPIGINAFVKFASWNKMKDSLTIPSYREPNPKDKKNPTIVYGAKLNMFPSAIIEDNGVRKEIKLLPPVLVDFTGGKRYRYNSSIVDEETAVDALIMTPDGGLFIRNSREDTDLATPLGRERQERVMQSRRHFESLMRRLVGVQAGGGNGGAGGGGIVLPGVKN